MYVVFILYTCTYQLPDRPIFGAGAAGAVFRDTADGSSFTVKDHAHQDVAIQDLQITVKNHSHSEAQSLTILHNTVLTIQCDTK